MPLDLRQYVRTSDRSWVQRHEQRLATEGKISLTDMICAMARTLDEVPVGKYFDIETSVKPENHEVFVKVVCDYMDTETDYRFNRLLNRVYHDEPIRMPKKITDEERKSRQNLDRARRRLPA